MMGSTGSRTTHYFPMCDIIANLMIFLFHFIYSYVVKNSIVILLAFACFTVAAIVALPLLIAAFVVTRIFQFIYGCGYMYDKATKLKTIIQLKLFLRTWLFLVTLYLMCVAVVLYGVAYVPYLDLKDVNILGYSFMHWVKTYFVIFGIGSMSYVFSIISIRFVMYCIPLEYHTFKSGSHVVSDTVHEIIDCFILLFLVEKQVIDRYIKFLFDYKILGFYPAHKLFHSLAILLVFHDLIGLSTHIFVWWLKKLVSRVARRNTNAELLRHKVDNKYLGSKSLLYWASGLKPSIMFTFTCLMLLLVWVFHFGQLIENNNEHDKLEKSKARANNKVLKVGTWTTLCLFIFSILWVVKSCVLLALENNIVYRKFGSKISGRGKDLYYLGVLGRGVYDFLELRYYAKIPPSPPPPPPPSSSSHQDEHNKTTTPQKKSGCLYKIKKTLLCWEIDRDNVRAIFTRDRGFSFLLLSIYPVFLTKAKTRYQHPKNDPNDYLGDGKQKKLSEAKKNQAKEDLVRDEGHHNVMLYQLQKMVQYFLGAKKALTKDTYTSDILNHLQRHGNGDGKITESTLRQLFNKENELKEFREMLDDKDVVQSSHRDEKNYVNVEQLEAWLEKTHNRCVVLAYTLSSAKKIVESLDRIMSVVLLILASIIWLLLTGLTTTDGIILVGSPILSFSFIFGSTCNMFFQGIVFVYVMHPFNVGDLCVIDNTMLEVIMISNWTTVFSKIDTQEKVIYPNSDLMNKKIINHKTRFDWNDTVELHVDIRDSDKINGLKQKIKTELQKGSKYEAKPGSMIEVVQTPENKMKIVTKLRYKTSLQAKSANYFECLKEKLNRRSEFIENILEVDEIMRDIPIINNNEPKFEVCVQH